MAKYYGVLGYAEKVETAPDVWRESIIERKYQGDVTRNTRRWESGEHLNDNLNIGNTISIVADAYAYQNFHKLRYITYMGAKWKIKTVEVNRPRLILQIGDVYNDQQSSVRMESVNG